MGCLCAKPEEERPASAPVFLRLPEEVEMKNMKKSPKKSRRAGDDMDTTVPVTLDPSCKGKDVHLDMARLEMSGNGICLGSTIIEQDSVYWEVKVSHTGPFRVGIAQGGKKGVLDTAQLGSGKSWCGDFSGDNALATDDVVGVAYSAEYQPMLQFYLFKRSEDGSYGEGDHLRELDVRRPPPPFPQVYPAVSVSEGATVSVCFDGDEFVNNSPPFKELVTSMDMISQ